MITLSHFEIKMNIIVIIQVDKMLYTVTIYSMRCVKILEIYYPSQNPVGILISELQIILLYSGHCRSRFQITFHLYFYFPFFFLLIKPIIAVNLSSILYLNVSGVPSSL